jgi:exosortase K
MINKITFWTVTTVVTAIALKYLHVLSETHDLFMILGPVKTFLQWIFQTKAIALDNGYHFAALNFTLDKSFSGGNFFILTFLVLSLTIPYHLFKPTRATLAFFSVLISCFVLTSVVTTVRILGILALIKLDNLFPWAASSWLFQAMKGFLYVAVLYLAYRLMKEKLTLRFKKFSYSDHYPSF